MTSLLALLWSKLHSLNMLGACTGFLRCTAVCYRISSLPRVRIQGCPSQRGTSVSVKARLAVKITTALEKYLGEHVVHLFVFPPKLLWLISAVRYAKYDITRLWLTFVLVQNLLCCLFTFHYVKMISSPSFIYTHFQLSDTLFRRSTFGKKYSIKSTWIWCDRLCRPEFRDFSGIPLCRSSEALSAWIGTVCECRVSGWSTWGHRVESCWRLNLQPSRRSWARWTGGFIRPDDPVSHSLSVV